MAAYNRVILLGNLTRDPERRELASGSVVADFGLAVNEKFKNKAGETEERAVFVDVTAWGKLADIVAEHLSKGSAVLCEGKLQQDSWTGKDGEKRTKLKVRADSIQFIGGKREVAPASQPPARTPEPEPTRANYPQGADDGLPF